MRARSVALCLVAAGAWWACRAAPPAARALPGPALAVSASVTDTRARAIRPGASDASPNTAPTFAPVEEASASVLRPADDGWAATHPMVAATVGRTGSLVVVIVVALCSNEQIACGGSALGSPGRLETNLYWGALYGARRFFDRPASGWDRIEATRPRAARSGDGEPTERDTPAVVLRDDAAGPAVVLERVVFRRAVAGARWGREGPVELVAVLEAVHGQWIDGAVDRFWSLATAGGEVAFREGERLRQEPVLVVGYAGHNRLLDGKQLPPAPALAACPLPSFVLACLSERFFAPPLRQAGSDTLLTTGAFMAPEGYAVEAVVRAIGDNLPRQRLREAAIQAATRWQGLAPGDAARTFVAPPAPAR